MTVCGTCNGSGWLKGCATSPYDFRDIRCPDCDGEGSWEDEPTCVGCDKPFVNGWCADCCEPLSELKRTGTGGWL